MAVENKHKLIEELGQRVSDVAPLEGEEDFMKSEETLARYLKSRDWNIEQAEKMLRATVEYRRKTKPLQLDCRWCHERPGYHSMRHVGFDESGRPVMYASFIQAATHKNIAEDAITHVTYLIENAKITMNPGISTWVFIMDCTGMSLSVCNPKLGYGVTQVMSDHYPERLGMVICINHSPVFQGVWRAIKMFLHSNTVAKMKLVRSKDKIVQLFHKYFSDELSNWLLAEIKLNKQRPLPRSQIEFWNKPQGGGHDPRGCPSYVSKYIESFVDRDVWASGRVHKPHPNIIGSFSGCVEGIPSAEHHAITKDREKDVTSDCSVDSDEENNVQELHIDDEYSIPSDAASLIP